MLSKVQITDLQTGAGPPVDGSNDNGSMGGGDGIVAARPAKRGGRARRPVLRTLRDAPFRLPVLVPPSFGRRSVDIRAHGAVGDGVTLCTAAFAAAIEACAAAGGGRVEVPAGTWLTGPIHLKSNINLHVQKSATVVFATDPAAHLPPVFVRWGGVECFNFSPLIYARDCSNIAITGSGTFKGQGAAWWKWAKGEAAAYNQLYRMVLAGTAVEARQLIEPDHLLRPQFIAPINCTNVLLEDFRIEGGGPGRTVHIAYCRNVIVRGLSIDAADGPNNDGIKIDSSQDVLIEECTLRTRGHCVSLKSGLNEDGWRVARPTEGIVIRRLRAIAGETGVMIGSTTAGGIRDVLVHDCEFESLGAGIRLLAARGRGGIVENVHVRDLRMGRLEGDAIRMDLQPDPVVSPAPRAPVFRTIRLSRIVCLHARAAVCIASLPDGLFHDIRLEDLTITAERGLLCDAGRGIELINVNIAPLIGPVFSVNNSQEVLIDGLHAPQDGVFLALRGRQTRRVRVRGESEQMFRPAIVLGADVPHDALVHE